MALWAIASVFLFPKLHQICLEAGVAIPTVYRVTRALTDFNFLIGGGLLALLVLLERRSRNWPRYRRAAIGISVFLLNTTVLILITLMVILALLAAPAMLHHGR